MAELCFTIKLTVSVLATGETVPSYNDESNDGCIAGLEIEHNQRISDGAKHHFNITYLRFKPLAFPFKRGNS